MITSEKNSLESITHLHESLLDKKIKLSVGGTGSFIKQERRGYKINVADADPNIEPYVALKHELFHAIFNSPVNSIQSHLEHITENVPLHHQKGVKKIAMSVWNILEDQRIESLGGEIWIGDRIGLSKTKKQVGATMESANTPLEALLASRFERPDLVPENLKGVEQFIKDVEKTDVSAGIVLAKRFVDQILVPWYKQQDEDEPEPPKPKGEDEGEDEGETDNPIDNDDPKPQSEDGEDGNPQPEGEGEDSDEESEDDNPQPRGCESGEDEDEDEDDPQGEGSEESDEESDEEGQVPSALPHGVSTEVPLTIWKNDVNYKKGDEVINNLSKWKAIDASINVEPNGWTDTNGGMNVEHSARNHWEPIVEEELVDEIELSGKGDNEFIKQQQEIAEVMNEESDHLGLEGDPVNDINWDETVNAMKEAGKRDIKEMKEKLAPAEKTVTAELLKAVEFSPKRPSQRKVEENTTLTGKLLYTMKQILGSTSPTYDTEGVELDIEKAIDYRLTRQDDEIFLEDEKDSGFSVVVTVDLSGSMSGHPEATAKTVAKSIFKAVDMIDGGKMELHGYDTSYGGGAPLSIGIAKNENEIHLIGDASGGTPTGGAIAYAREALSKMGGIHKVMFVITDGYPNTVTTIADGDNFDAIKECQLQVATAIRQGIHVYGIGIGRGCELSEIFGKSWTSCNDINKSMDTLVRGMKQEIVRYLN